MMSIRGHKELCSLSLLVVLLWPAVPAGSQEVVLTERGYDLQLESALAGKEYSFQLDGSAENDTAQAIRVSDLRLTTFRNVWELSEEEMQATPAAPAEPKKKRKAGRWLKKHWYVPVLVGLLLGGVVLDDDDDDDDSEDSG